MAEKMTYKYDTRYPNGGSPVAFFPVAALTDLESGELVGWDNDDPGLKRYVRDGTGNIKFVGITRDSQKSVAKLGNQAALAPDRISVFTTGVHALLGTVGETVKHGTAIYMSGTNTQKVTSTAASGVQIGIAWYPDGTSVTGAVDWLVKIDDFTVTQA